MKLFYAIAFVLFCTASFGQSSRQYLNKYKKEIASNDDARYYREIIDAGSDFVVKDYYLENEQLEMEAHCSEVKPQLIFSGPYKTYYKNGILKEDGFYDEDKRQGVWKEFHDNGQQELEIFYNDRKSSYHQYWDASGKAYLVNGTGYFVRTSEVAANRHYEIVDQELIGNYSISDKGDTTYFVVQETATYKGGMPGFYKELSQTMRYPAHARRMGIEGKVFVEFTVEKNGNVSNIKVLMGPDETLNEEAARVMALMNKWTPGKVRGKPVAQKLVLPVSFKLGGRKRS